MTKHEKEAVLGYLEFVLTEMVQGLETEKIIYGSPQVGKVYDAAYEALNEMERTLNEEIELVSEERTKVKK